MNRRITFYLLILLLVFSLVLINKRNSFAANRTIRILFVGNSLTYFNDLPSMVTKIGSKAKEKIHIETFMVARAGDSWEKIVKDRISTGSQYLNLMESEKWDYVVLQDNSQAPIYSRNGMIRAAETLVKVHRKYDAKTIFFMTWAPQKKPNQIIEISGVYFSLGQSLDVQVSPVGLVWDQIIKDSKINLYSFDGIHPSRIGTLLAACTIFSTITNQPCEMSQEYFPMNIPKKDVANMLNTAWELGSSKR